MARKEAYYFSHDSNAQDDPKCMLLIDQLGMEGYGIFWALIEKLRSEKSYKLPFIVCASFAKRWGTSKEKVEAVIKSYSLFTIDDEGYFFSLRLKTSMETKSIKAKESVSKRWENTNVLRANTNVIRNDTIKVKESKVKNISKDIDSCFSFENFWSAYPNKVAKVKCEKKYNAISESDRQKIKDTIQTFIAHKPFADYKHPYPETYLNQKRWNDEINQAVKPLPIIDQTPIIF